MALELLFSNLFEFDVSLSVVEAALMLAAEQFSVSGEDLDSVAVHDAVVSIGAFRAAIRRRSRRWEERAIEWKLTLGKAHQKLSAWLDLELDSGDGQMILWVSGEAELIWSLGGVTTQEPRDHHGARPRDVPGRPGVGCRQRAMRLRTQLP